MKRPTITRISEPETIEIRGIWLIREGVESNPHAKAVVLVEMPDGVFKRAIVERIDGNFSHYVYPEGIRNSPEGPSS